jgi:hypothetical protein
MNTQRWRRAIAPLLLVLFVIIGGCATTQTSRFDQAQQESTQSKATPAVSKAATDGSKFNKFFPTSGNGFNRVYTQEKDGFANAKLEKDGKTLALMSINDTISNPAAATKFQQSTKSIGGYPAVNQGNTATAVLVVDRYQVKVTSKLPAEFTVADRETWLGKFDLAGLARVK